MTIDRERLAKALWAQEWSGVEGYSFEQEDESSRQYWLKSADAILSDISAQGYVIVPEHSIKGPAAWLDRWAEHVGSCKGGDVCTCGLTRARYDINAANPEQTEQ